MCWSWLRVLLLLERTTSVCWSCCWSVCWSRVRWEKSGAFRVYGSCRFGVGGTRCNLVGFWNLRPEIIVCFCSCKGLIVVIQCVYVTLPHVYANSTLVYLQGLIYILLTYAPTLNNLLVYLDVSIFCFLPFLEETALSPSPCLTVLG